MPRERVKSDSGNESILVGWSPNGTLQVGIETAPGVSIITQLYGSDHRLKRIGERAWIAGWRLREGREKSPEHIRELGRQVLFVVEGSRPAGEPDGQREDAYTSLWVPSLDRHGANSLIRYVRKARDSVFGKDE